MHEFQFDANIFMANNHLSSNRNHLSHFGVPHPVPTNHILPHKSKFYVIFKKKLNMWQNMIGGDKMLYIKMGQVISVP